MAERSAGSIRAKGNLKSKLAASALAATVLLAAAVPPARACRFWAAVSMGGIPGEVARKQLLEGPKSLKSLAHDNPDGWSVGYYGSSGPQVARGKDSAQNDADFDKAVLQAAAASPGVIVSHIRRAVSGCTGVPNPHPFRRRAGDREWLFGHNGAVRKKVLIGLIGDAYLAEHPPAICADSPPDSWVDSELYFILILKAIDEQGGDVEKGITEALRSLSWALRFEQRTLNFFLTDGDTVYAYRYGYSLYYSHQDKPPLSVVASSVPSADGSGWKSLDNGTLVIMRPGAAPAFKYIQ